MNDVLAEIGDRPILGNEARGYYELVLRAARGFGIDVTEFDVAEPTQQQQYRLLRLIREAEGAMAYHYGDRTRADARSR